MLIETIKKDMTTAMKAKEKVKVQTLRAVMAAVKEVEVSGSSAKTLTDAEVQKVIANEAKRRVEAAEAFEAGGANDRAETERAQLAVLEEYLPEAMTEGELDALVAAELAVGGWTSKADMGVAMKAINAKVAGRADGRLVADMVKAKLN